MLSYLKYKADQINKLILTILPSPARHIPFYLILLVVCQPVSVEQRIEKIENGLIKAVIIEDHPVEKNRILDRLEYHHVPGVSIAVINNFKIEWARGYGVTDAVTEKPVTTETLFQTASISKPVAAMAALKMVQDGLLDLHEDVNDKLISWKVPENEFTRQKPVTLRGLLNHSAGVTVHGFMGYAHDDVVPTLIQVLDGATPANSDPVRVDILPDSTFRYSGGGYCIMQQLLIDLNKKSFPEILRETVFVPLGMVHSTYEQPLPEAQRASVATAHRSRGNPIEGQSHTYPEMAAAGLWTTPSDLARFAIEIMRSRTGKSEKVLSRETVKTMLTLHHGNYGLGLSIRGSGDDFRFAHGGDNAGFKCQLVVYPERGQGAAIMTNGDQGSALYNEILRSIAAEYGWPDYQPKIKSVARVDPAIYDGYIGRYRFSPEIVVIISKEDDRLCAQIVGEEKNECFPKSDTTYFFTDEDIEITFKSDKRGSITEMIAIVNGNEVKGKKIE